MLTLLQAFTEMAKQAQLYIQQPSVAALIYARNSKTGSYTGFYQDIPKNSLFDHRGFLAAHALPGPKSIVHCVLQHEGERESDDRCIGYIRSCGCRRPPP